jgi:translation elongation factor EF-Ts
MPLRESKSHTGQHPHYTVEVGRLCAAWSFFEFITDRIIWAILKVDHKIGSMITANKDMQGRWSLIVNHAEPHVTASEMAMLRKINSSLAIVANDRNIIVHGQIMTKNPSGQSYAILSRGASAGKWHPLTSEGVKVVMTNIVKLSYAARDIGNAHLWLEEKPTEKIVSDWPKPLEGFPELPVDRLKSPG